MDVTEVRADLLAEQQSLDDIMSSITEEQWAMPTPSPGWSVADQIGHLAYFDNTAAMAITDPEAFKAGVEALMSGETDGDDLTLSEYRAMSPAELLGAWRANRSTLAAASASLENDTRVIWYGPSMGSKSFLTARLMECWAHGQDIVDTLGLEREAADRLRNIAQLGFITRGWTYMNRGEEVPEGDVKVVLEAPSGDTWTFGAEDATESAVGPALDFCLVVTQRRHLDDTDLTVPPLARDWLEKAQAYAGPATDGPAAGLFR